MFRTYRIDDQQVAVSRMTRQHPVVYTLQVAGAPLAGTVEKRLLGTYVAVDGQDRRLGAFLGLQEAVARVVHEECPPPASDAT